MLKSLAYFFGLATAATAAPALQTEIPVAPSPGLNMTSLSFLGTGCPPGSTYFFLNTDKTALTLTSTEPYVEAGPGIAIGGNRKTCNLTLGSSVLPGFTLGIESVEYRGYYQLDSKVTARQQISYSFQGQLVQATSSFLLNGPITGAEYTYRNSFDLASSVTSPCGQSAVLNIYNDLRISNAANKKGSGYVGVDPWDIGGSFSTTFNFYWQTCKQAVIDNP